MPVSISCPKCNKQYNLPEKFLGKGVQCKKCGTQFVAGGQQQPASAPVPVANTGEQLSNQQLNQFGIEGNLQRAPEIFGAPAPPPGPGLGNFAGEDPGFGGENFQLPTTGTPAADNENPYAAVLQNPALRPKKKKKKKRGSDRPAIDYDSYAVARYGMNSIFYAMLYMLIIGTLGALFVLVARTSPETVASIIKSISESETMINVVNFIANVIFKWGLVGNALALFVGQICCIFAPKTNERVNAGLAFGLFFGAGIVLVTGLFLIGLAAFATIGSREPGDAADSADLAAAGAIGIGGILIGLLAVAFVFASMFFFINYYKVIGQNIQSDALKASAHMALIAFVANVAASFILGFAGGFLASMMGESGGPIVSEVVNVIGFIFNMASSCMMLLMVKTALDELTPR